MYVDRYACTLIEGKPSKTGNTQKKGGERIKRRVISHSEKSIEVIDAFISVTTQEFIMGIAMPVSCCCCL